MAVFEVSERPEELDKAIRLKLAGSLSHIDSRAGEYLDHNPAELEACLRNIRETRQDPGVFARYFDLVFAIKACRYADANALLAEIMDRAARPIEFSIIRYGRDALGEDVDRFPRLLFSENDGANPMVSPAIPVFEAYRQQLLEAKEIIRLVDEGQNAEIENLLLMICVARRNESGVGGSLGGVTSLMVWGAAFVNMDSYGALWETVQFFVHEVTHALLFGLSIDRPLVLNDPGESYRSPLRTTTRPMDGIFHAVLVCARTIAFNRMWLESGLVEKGSRDEVRQLAETVLDKFKDGVGVIQEHGILSERGSDLLAQSCETLKVPY